MEKGKARSTQWLLGSRLFCGTCGFSSVLHQGDWPHYWPHYQFPCKPTKRAKGSSDYLPIPPTQILLLLCLPLPPDTDPYTAPTGWMSPSKPFPGTKGLFKAPSSKM